MKYTFEELPQAISALYDKVDNIKDLLLESQKVPPPHSDLLTIKQAADFMTLSVPTLYTKVSRKEIPVNKRGKRLYFSTAELNTWIKSGRKKTQEEIRAPSNLNLSKKPHHQHNQVLVHSQLSE